MTPHQTLGTLASRGQCWRGWWRGTGGRWRTWCGSWRGWSPLRSLRISMSGWCAGRVFQNVLPFSSVVFPSSISLCLLVSPYLLPPLHIFVMCAIYSPSALRTCLVSCIYLSRCLSFSLFLSLSMSLALFLCIIVCLRVCLSMSLSIYLSVCLFVSACLCLRIPPLSLSLSPSLSRSLYLSLSISLYLSLSRSLSSSLSLSFSIVLALFPSLSISSLPFTIYPFVRVGALSLSLSPPFSPSRFISFVRTPGPEGTRVLRWRRSRSWRWRVARTWWLAPTSSTTSACSGGNLPRARRMRGAPELSAPSVGRAGRARWGSNVYGIRSYVKIG